MTKSITFAEFQEKINSVNRLISAVHNTAQHVSYQELDTLEKQLQAFVKNAEVNKGDTSPVFPLTLPGQESHPVYIHDYDWRDNLAHTVYRSIAVQRGDTGDIDAWMRNLKNDGEQEERLLNSTFGDMFLDGTDMEEIVEAVLTLIRKNIGTPDSTFFFDTSTMESLIDPQMSVQEFINLVKNHIP